MVVSVEGSCSAFLTLFSAKVGSQLSAEDRDGLLEFLKSNEYLFEATLNDCVSQSCYAGDDSVLADNRFSRTAGGDLARASVYAIRADIAPTFEENLVLVGKRSADTAAAEVLDHLKRMIGHGNLLDSNTLNDVRLVLQAALHYALPKLLDKLLLETGRKHLRLLQDAKLPMTVSLREWLEGDAGFALLDAVLTTYELVPQFDRDECFRLLIAYGWRVESSDTHRQSQMSACMLYYSRIEQTYLEQGWVDRKRMSLHPNLKLLTQLPFRLIGHHRLAADIVETVGVHWFSRADKSCLVLLFAGDTGTGKTELAEAIGRLTNNTNAADYITIKCGETSTKAELLGSAGNFFNADRPTALGAFFRSKQGQYGVVILDEFDQLNRDAINALYTVLDKGEATDFQGSGQVQTTTLDVSKLVFVLTTNVPFPPEQPDSLFREQLIAYGIPAPFAARMSAKFQFRDLTQQKEAITQFFLQRAARRITVGSRLQPNSRPRHLIVDGQIAEHAVDGSQGGAISDAIVASSGIRFVKEWAETEIKKAVQKYEEAAPVNSQDRKTLRLNSTPNAREKITAVAI